MTSSSRTSTVALQDQDIFPIDIWIAISQCDLTIDSFIMVMSLSKFHQATIQNTWGNLVRSQLTENPQFTY